MRLYSFFKHYQSLSINMTRLLLKSSERPGHAGQGEQYETSGKGAGPKKWAAIVVLCSSLGSLSSALTSGCSTLPKTGPNTHTNTGVQEAKTKRSVQELAVALGNPNVEIRRDAAWSLANAAKAGVDISDAISALGVALDVGDFDVRNASIQALTTATANHKSRNAALNVLGAALGNKSDKVQGDAAWALGKVAEDGVDITAFVGALVKALGAGRTVRVHATMTLEHAIINKTSRNAALKVLGAALDDMDADVRSGAAGVLRNVAENGVDTRAFDEKLKLIPF